ncbi:ADAM 17-like protease, partial [Argonauta hians]
MSESCCFTKTLLVSVMLASVSVVSGSIQDKLFYFETLKAKDVEVITKRSIDTDPSSHLTLVHLQGLGRNFNFYLHSSHRLLTRDFSVSTVNGTGHKTPLLINKSAFYEGALLDDKESHVDAVWEEDNLLATITTPEDTYIVEPSWRHLPSSSNHSMIIYKGSDMKSSNYSISHHSHHSCGHKSGVAHPKEEFGKWQSKLYKESGYNESVPFSHSHSNNNHRPRRKSNVEKKTCELMIIADYRYFVAIGRGSSVATVNYMVHTISKVDMIFRATVWDDDDKGILKNMGLKIKKAVVYKEYSPKGHYNSKTNLEYDKLLTFVLALFFNPIELVFNLEEKCPSVSYFTAYYIPDAIFSFNTGLTTTSHSDGSPVLTLRSQLVTGHGHNWGSGHDLETVECSPSSADGENIEYSYCGNSRVDTYAAEECDEGMLEGPAVGLCCDNPYNEECCSLNCTVAPKGTRCRTVAENSSFCLKNTSC